MDFLTRFGIEKSRVTILVMLGLLVQGLLVYSLLPKREDPAITIRTAVVVVQFPGMSPQRMEEVIVTLVERKAREIGEIEDINSLVATGSATIYLNLYNSVPRAKIETVFQEIRNKMAGVKKDLPSGTQGPFVNTDYGDVAVATVAVTGEGFTYAQISDIAQDLQKSLYTIDGVAKVILYGEQKERIWLEINSRKLAAVGIQIGQVLADLEAQNIILPAGRLNAGGVNLILEANGDLGSVEEIGNVLTKIQGLAGFVRLKDLLTVRRGYQDPKVKPVYFNGQPAVMAAIEMSAGVDIQDLGLRLKDAVARFEQRQPIGISYRFSTYQEAKVTQSINGALTNVAQTLAVVLLVMLLFLGLRPALIIACIVPFAVTFALIGMSLLGISLEQVSIAAVIISLGLLVDNGLVVVEDMQGRRMRGASATEAALASGRQFMLPLGVASVTTVSAFLPILLLEGTEGEYAFSLGAVVGLMLLGSWLAALYILPALSVWTAKFSKAQRSGLDLTFVVDIYGGIIRHSIRFSPIIILAAYGAVVASGFLFSSLKKEMFPLSERNQFLIYMDMPKGTSINALEGQALTIDRWLRDKSVNPEVSDTTIYVGDGGPRFYLALAPADAVPSSAFFLINTEDFAGAVDAAQRAQRYLFANHPEARFKIKRLSMGGGESGIVEIKIFGPDADTLLARAKELENIFAQAPGIIQNENDWGNKTIKIIINISQDKARELGVTSKSISNVMEAFFSGSTVSTYREGDNSIPIVVRAGQSFRDSLEDLQNLSIVANGQLISLDRVAQFEPSLEIYQLRHLNQTRVIKISAKSGTLSATQLLAYVQPTLDTLDLGPSYRFEIDGETKVSSEVNGKLGAGLPAALLVMLAALMFQFNSARRVLLTFMTVPLIVVGAPIALILTSQPLSFFAILGMISLAGIIINNAIVLIDQIDIERRTQPLVDAIITAAKKRVTPILLTSLTTVFGLMPMAIAGGALWEPMAALMIGGLSVASVITLFFVPSTYYLLFRDYSKPAPVAAQTADEIEI
ncbi:MAG: efflux RND transporter permease subunit [Alphaproteobacteria bacterium]